MSLFLDLPHCVFPCIFSVSFILCNPFLYERADNGYSRSSALYRLVALQLFSSFTALSLAGFLLKYEYGVWVICALAVGCRALSVGISVLLPSGRAVELNTDRQSVEVDTSMERRRYRDFMHEDQQFRNFVIFNKSRYLIRFIN